MSHYRYSPLSPRSESIRLLRLVPHKDETAPIQCELFEYSLQESSKGTHLYEALSYVWGSPETPKSISIDKHNLPVTANLHAALSRLRDRSFERIIWVDFVCINQEDEEEKERQIQSMAKIYGQASRVIVYLGEAADDSDQALEDIRVAAEDESTTLSNSEKSQKAILKLLRRPWFRRIWVLQEVALARRILIMCGSSEMNGYTFCSGFNKLELSYQAHPDLQSLIRSVTYLIRGAIFRPKYAMSPLGGLSLGELIDMYHTHEATKRHDKVYALLGMSSDDPNAAGLSPDYTVPWKTVLQRLIEFILFKEVSVEAWDEKEIAVIKSKGCILGQVTSVEDDSARYDRQHVNVILNNTHPDFLEYEGGCNTRWTLQASAKSIRQNDLVCLLQGASKPTIIRAYKDHFAVIMIAVTLRQSVRTESRYVERQEPLASAKSFLRNFLLVWNWKKSPGDLQDQARYETSAEINDLVSEYLNTASNKAVRSCNVALALGDSQKHKEAEKRLQEAIEGCERAFGKEDPHTLAGIDGLALVYKSQQQWTKAEDLFLQVIQIRKRVQGMDHQDTLSSIANLALTYIYQDHPSSRERERITSLIDRIRDNVQITEKDVVQAATSFGKELVTLLLDLKRDNIPITEEVVKAAASNENSGKEVMVLLLDQRGNEVKITEEVVKAAARNGDSGEVMALLLDQRGDEVKITEEVVEAAAGNWRSGEKVMALLLDQRGDEVKITEEVVKAAARNRDSGEKVMALLLDQRGDEVKITEEVVKAAARNRDSGEVMELLLDQRGDEVKITEEVVEAAAGNWEGKQVIALLLDQRSAEVKITEGVVKAAVGNWEGKEVMALLFDQRGDEVKITEEVLKAAARNGNGGKEVMALLLDQRGAEVKITEEVLKEAASNESISYEMVQLLHQTVGIEVTIGVIKAAATSGQEQVLGLLNQWNSITGDEEQWLNISRLYNAAKNGDAPTVRRLVADGIPPDKRNIRGVTPLWRASASRQTEVVEVLLATSAVNVNVQSTAGRTPLFWAAAHGHSKVVRLLLDHGAEPNYTDKDGRSPLSVAQLNRWDTIVAMLTGHESTT
ncbi:related to heterokaryon incompatibility protein [Phialocephala subalpina]|uniref:Related to heterokaryon incompatibility protein n=1 Tax=Phialocephala subalpina TaxID=576137 RepID=A0A1L7XTM5_9HELO|nr:related to heterokaryon incompatibility protein [Phialocephala subalpina]